MKNSIEFRIHDKCRNCFHFDYQHCVLSLFEKQPCSEVVKTGSNRSDPTILVTDRCECFNYEPLDNLKWLEEKYLEKFQ